MIFGVEVLDGLEVEQTVGGFLIVVLIGLHLFFEVLGSCLCEFKCDKHINKQSQKLNTCELPRENSE